jgi:hypothetical protein
MILPLVLYFNIFLMSDKILSETRLQGIYYLIHALHNMRIVWITAADVVHTVTDFHSLDEYPKNMEAIALVAALHFYHIVCYFPKMRFDDWLHHILMIFVALPIGYYLPSASLMGYSLFFTSGLPSTLDYILLFGVRNFWVHRMTEKRVNRWLNVWLRAPGCISHAALTLTWILSNKGTWEMKLLGCIPAVLTYWNGQYFMQQVVEDHVRLSAEERHQRLV